MFAKILLCLDGSSLSEQLVPYTAEIAQRFGSRVVLLQVLQMSSALAVASVQGAEYVIEQERRRLSARLTSTLRESGPN